MQTPSGEPQIEAEVRPRANGRARCGGCLARAPGYDRQPARRFEFVPLWGLKVYLRYAPRRVSCPDCGVRVEHLPWASGKRRLTEAYAWFLARWAKRLSYKEAATVFRTSWDHVFAAVERAVEWGRAHRDLSGIEALGAGAVQFEVEANLPDPEEAASPWQPDVTRTG